MSVLFIISLSTKLEADIKQFLASGQSEQLNWTLSTVMIKLLKETLSYDFVCPTICFLWPLKTAINWSSCLTNFKSIILIILFITMYSTIYQLRKAAKIVFIQKSNKFNRSCDYNYCLWVWQAIFLFEGGNQRDIHALSALYLMYGTGSPFVKYSLIEK